MAAQRQAVVFREADHVYEPQRSGRAVLYEAGVYSRREPTDCHRRQRFAVWQVASKTQRLAGWA